MSHPNLIVGGVPRSGKTTLCKRVARDLRFTHVSLDSLVHAFEKAFPELGISNDAADYNKLCDRIKPFLFEHLSWLSKFEIPFVLDAYYLRPQDLADLNAVGGVRAVFLGYPTVNVVSRLSMLRSNESDTDWTSQFSDQIVLDNLSGFARASVKFRDWCSSSGFTFIDVSEHWSAKLDEAYHMLVCVA